MSMRSLSFDKDTGLIINSDDNLSIVTDLNALVQKIEQRLRFFLTEWFLDTSQGVAYFQEIFEKPENDTLIVNLLNAEILKESDVNSVSDATIDYDITNRNFSYSATVNTIYGSSTVSTE